MWEVIIGLAAIGVGLAVKGVLGKKAQCYSKGDAHNEHAVFSPVGWLKETATACQDYLQEELRYDENDVDKNWPKQGPCNIS